jgi:DNA-binding PadR family transcriptional regulator
VDNLKISKQQIYRSLKHLYDRGIIVAEADGKDAFSALLFEKALELLIETEKAHTQILQETKETVLSEWKVIRKSNAANS